MRVDCRGGTGYPAMQAGGCWGTQLPTRDHGPTRTTAARGHAHFTLFPDSTDAMPDAWPDGPALGPQGRNYIVVT